DDSKRQMGRCAASNDARAGPAVGVSMRGEDCRAKKSNYYKKKSGHHKKVGRIMGLISVNTFWTLWLLIHLLLSVALIGALTHQAVSVTMPVRKAVGPGGFVTRFRAVSAPGYATAVCILWVLTFLVGSFIYTKYRIY